MPISNKEQKTSVPVTLELRKTTYEAVTAGIEGGEYVTSSTLSNRASRFFENLADGGMMLTSDQVKKIEEAIKKTVRNGADVVNAATKPVAIEDNCFIVQVKVDPAWIEPLKIRATEASRTVDELMSDAILLAFESNWLFNLMPASGAIYADSSDLKAIARFTGKAKPTGRDIADAIRGMAKEGMAA